MKRFEILFFTLLLPCLLPLCWSSTAKADGVVFQRQTIQNTLGKDVNDARIRVNVDPKGGKVTNENDPSKNGKAVVQNQTLVFAQGLFGTLKNGEKIFVDFGPAENGSVVDVTWTINGDPQGGGFKILGQPMPILFNAATNEAAAIFFNPESFPITYSNIMLFANNNMANFNIDQYLIPTGTLIAGPGSITLAPGESFTFSFGVVDPSLYQLALAQVAATSDPNNLFQVATAAAVPEPTSLLLLGTGLAGVAMNMRKKRRGNSKVK